MRCSLWPDASTEEHLAELDHLIRGGMNGTLPLVILVAVDDTGELAGFLEVGLRSDAVLRTQLASWKDGSFRKRFASAAGVEH